MPKRLAIGGWWCWRLAMHDFARLTHEVSRSVRALLQIRGAAFRTLLCDRHLDLFALRADKSDPAGRGHVESPDLGLCCGLALCDRELARSQTCNGAALCAHKRLRQLLVVWHLLDRGAKRNRNRVYRSDDGERDNCAVPNVSTLGLRHRPNPVRLEWEVRLEVLVNHCPVPLGAVGDRRVRLDVLDVTVKEGNVVPRELAMHAERERPSCDPVIK